MQASLPLEMLRSWDFLDHGEKRIKPILRHPEKLTVNSSLRNITLCHPELVSGSSHSKTLGSTQKEEVVASTMGQMPKQVRHDIMWGRKAAFTLAEVLITLGIIGVVAALTLPTLIANYQKQVYVNQLKKSVSVLSQGFTTMMGHDGVTRLSDTEAFAGMPSSNCSPTNILTDDCRSLKEGLESVFASMRFSPGNGADLYFLNGNYANLKSTNSQLIEFPDGSEIWNYGFYKMPVGSAYSAGGYVGFLYLDVNGSKNPNTIGRDIFQVYIGNNGTVYAAGSQVASEMFSGNPNTYYWRTAAQNSSFTCSPDSYGDGCAARVLEEDAMNY